MRDGQFIHVVKVTTPSNALAEMHDAASVEALRGISAAFVVIEECRTYPDPMHIVKVIAETDDQDAANRIGAGSAATYGATFFALPVHDRATCRHIDCVEARMDPSERERIANWAVDADRIDATPGRYW